MFKFFENLSFSLIFPVFKQLCMCALSIAAIACSSNHYSKVDLEDQGNFIPSAKLRFSGNNAGVTLDYFQASGEDTQTTGDGDGIRINTVTYAPGSDVAFDYKIESVGWHLEFLEYKYDKLVFSLPFGARYFDYTLKSYGNGEADRVDKDFYTIFATARVDVLIEEYLRLRLMSEHKVISLAFAEGYYIKTAELVYSATDTFDVFFGYRKVNLEDADILGSLGSVSDIDLTVSGAHAGFTVNF